MKRILFAFAFTAIFIFSGFSQNTIKSIIDRGELRVGLTGDQPP